LVDWKILSTETLCKTPHLQTDLHLIATPSRPEGVKWNVVHRSEAAVVIPRLSDGHYVLIRQERPAVQEVTLEFPAGQVDCGDIIATAHRELHEEAGLECQGELVAVGSFFSSVGFTDERAHLFLAKDCAPASEPGTQDANEAISEVVHVSPSELEGMISDGTIQDANTLACYARLVARGLFRNV